jgi:calcium-independent phospholipase A2-gamma
MATIYMLHIETSIHSKHERPIMDNGQEGVDMRRREALKRFAKWVPCRCSSDCGKEWNFVNEIGLSRPEGDDDKCGIAKLLGRGSIRNLVASKNLKALEDTRKFWYMATL